MQQLLKKSQALKQAKNILLVICGTLILAFGTAVFIIPFNLVAGGVAGTSIILKQIIPYEFITTDLIIAILSWTLFFIGLIFLGKAFAVKTLISTIIYPTSISFFSNLVASDVLGGLLSFEDGMHSGVSPLLAALFGGVLVGCGCALTFLGGGSTGGMDILAFIFCKIFKKLRSSVAIFIVDSLIIVAGLFVIKSLTLTLLGVVTAFVSAIVIDKVFLGESQAFVAQIISDKSDKISAEIIDKLSRTTTEISVVGGYLKTERKMLMVSFTLSQYADLLTIINRADKDAFLTVHRAHEVNGQGWTK